ncbi:MAG TPA: PAS domain-containing protein [Gemmatimonadales bacterium]|nr:PAS domain-containing protein [Gemmatimonadales bacterium]
MSGPTPDFPSMAPQASARVDPWRAWVEQVKDYAIFMIDPRGYTVTWNQGVERVLGYSEREFIGLPAWRLFPVRDRAAMVPESELETAARDGQASDDRWMLRKDGTEFWASGITSALRDASGGLEGFAKVMRDSTAERRSTELLRASEERLRETEHRLMTALDAAGMGTWRWNLLTNEEDLDKGLSRMLGLEAGESVQTMQDVLDRVHPEDYEAVRAAFSQSAQSGADLDIEFRVMRSDGGLRWIRAHGQVFYDAEGDPVTMTGACVDVTRRREVEEQLRQAHRMDAVGRLAGGVAHEVNNMMTVILGFSDIILPTLDQGDDRYADLLQVRKAAARAAMVTGQLLAFSRRQMLQPQALGLNGVLEQLRPILLRLLGADKRLDLTLAPDLWRVYADRGQIEQVLINLTINARDAMTSGGWLAIQTANVRLDDAYAGRHAGVRVPPGRYVQMAVTDTGSGIPHDVQTRIFEPFFTTKPVGQGTGLGLSMVYGLVKQSNGFIWVYSEPAHGTTFKLYFPATDSDAPADHQPGALQGAGGAETVLVVEDDDLVRPLTVRLLEVQGYSVVEARHGGEALEILARPDQPIDVVLADVVMPEMGGSELASRIAASGVDLPVVLMSGFTDDEIARRGLLAPGVPYLQKPFDASQLGQRLREALAARRSGGQA